MANTLEKERRTCGWLRSIIYPFFLVVQFFFFPLSFSLSLFLSLTLSSGVYRKLVKTACGYGSPRRDHDEGKLIKAKKEWYVDTLNWLMKHWNIYHVFYIKIQISHRNGINFSTTSILWGSRLLTITEI